MRIWHLMVGVLAVAVLSALFARLPELGRLVVLDVVVLACAFLLVRVDGRVLGLWQKVVQRSDQEGGLRGKCLVVGAGAFALVYIAITSLVLTAAGLLVIVSSVSAVAIVALELIKRFNEIM